MSVDAPVSEQDVAELKQAIDANDLPRVQALMTREPALHAAPMGYGKDGPLTWVAECRVPWGPPSDARLAMAAWMIDHGSDVHQGGDGPLMRASLNDDRLAMMEVLVARGADVNAVWHGHYPIIFGPCECVAPRSLEWLLKHGANPNCDDPNRMARDSGTALDYAIGTYARSPKLAACIDLLIAAGGRTKFNEPAVLAILRSRLDVLARLLDADASLVHRRFPALDFGTTGARNLTLKGGTLLHVAAEYGVLDAARLLLDRGADVNAKAAVNENGVGGQTPIFHAATQYGDAGLDVARLLIDRGADLTPRPRIPGHYDRPDEAVECTPLEYAERFPGDATASATVMLLRERVARV